MALSLNKPKLDNLASDIWKSAERLRGKFKEGPPQIFDPRMRDWPAAGEGGGFDAGASDKISRER